MRSPILGYYFVMPTEINLGVIRLNWEPTQMGVNRLAILGRRNVLVR